MRAVIAAALLLAAGCDGGMAPAADGGVPPGPVGPYSCRASLPGADGGAGTLVICLDAVGGTAQDLASNRQMCELQNNTFVLEPCPRENALGGCRQSQPGIELTIWYYADGSPTTPSDIQMLCEGLPALPGVTITFVTP
jgi:hypothetical protein